MTYKEKSINLIKAYDSTDEDKSILASLILDMWTVEEDINYYLYKTLKLILQNNINNIKELISIIKPYRDLRVKYNLLGIDNRFYFLSTLNTSELNIHVYCSHMESGITLDDRFKNFVVDYVILEEIRDLDEGVILDLSKCQDASHIIDVVDFVTHINKFFKPNLNMFSQCEATILNDLELTTEKYISTYDLAIFNDLVRYHCKALGIYKNSKKSLTNMREYIEKIRDLRDEKEFEILKDSEYKERINKYRWIYNWLLEQNKNYLSKKD